MSKTSRFLSGLCAAALASQIAGAAQEGGSPMECVPADAFLAVEVMKPQAVLSPFDEKGAAMLTALPGVQDQLAKPGVKQFFQIVKVIENQLGTEWRAGLGQMTGGGVAFAMCPQERNVFIAEASDVSMTKRLNEFLLKAAASKKSSDGSTALFEAQPIDGVPAWTLGPKETHVIAGNLLIISSGAEGVRAALAQRAKGAASSLAATPAYQAAKRAVGPDAAAMVFVNTAMLKQFPGFAEKLNFKNANPLAVLLFAGIGDAVQGANWLALGVRVKDGGLALQLASDAKPAASSPSAFALPAKSGDGILPNITVPRQIAAFSFYRDLRRFYQAKDQLFPERTSGLIFFENMMGIFFSGRDMTDDVFAQAAPEVRFVVANQEYDPAIGTPEAQIPAFAVILRLRDPAKSNEMLEEAFQKSIGLASFTRGQQAQPGFIIERPVHWNTRYTVARFPSAAIKDRARLDIRYNFRPTLAMPGQYLVISSTDGLAADLMDALGREAKQMPAPLAGIHSLAELDGAQVSAVLQRNLDIIARGNMVKQGRSLEDARAQMNALITAAQVVSKLRLTIGADAGASCATLDVDLCQPAKGKGLARAR
ncbi:MAG: hypothetical protein HZA91_16165 [Verrucomicrobia bacterium]|nr:hypothetical protein [Verrucomicrobiota bacterium]